ncbi:hypothetical protein ADK57_03150 [Streptomyces sp. MMG1533]|nr:hypothetical protein ADK57_03150 [Streptomyces sp. MMG1533]
MFVARADGRCPPTCFAVRTSTVFLMPVTIICSGLPSSPTRPWRSAHAPSFSLRASSASKGPMCPPVAALRSPPRPLPAQIDHTDPLPENARLWPINRCSSR